MDQLQTETRIAELQVRQERDNKRLAELEYHRAQAVVELRTIHSPVDGVVMERFKSVGEYVEDQPVLRIAQLDPLHVETIIPVEFLGRIRQGMQARVHPDVTTDDPTELVARVERVDPVSDAASGTFGVRLSLPNQDYQVPAGLRCKLSFFDPGDAEIPEPVALEPIGPHSEPEGDPVVAQPEVVPAPPVESAREATLASRNKLECFMIGPYPSESDLTEPLATLNRHDFEARQRVEAKQLSTGLLVFATTGTDAASRKQTVQRIEQAGIKDYFVLRKGPNKGRISLGYFKEPEQARAWLAHLAAVGVDAELVPREEPTNEFWLDVRTTDGERLVGTVESDGIVAATVGLHPAACTEGLVVR